MIYQLDTLLHNPSENDLTEIEVIDCTHPLYGRRFPLVSLSRSPQGSRQALVTYKKDILLRIPFSATNLSASQPALSNAKISYDAVTELIDLARQLNILHQEGNQE